MRALIPTFILLLLAGVMAANDSLNKASFQCRTDHLEFPADFTVGQRVKADLQKGVWNEEVTLSRTGKILQFSEDGTAVVICFDRSGAPFYKEMRWDVEEYENLPYLTLRDAVNQRESLFRVETTCKGVMLTNVVTYEEMHLLHTSPKPSEAIRISFDRLEGSWSNATNPNLTARQVGTKGQEEKVAYIQYEFNEDGTYLKRYGTSKVHFEEKGIFELSHDGQFIFFHARPKGSSETISTHVARIKYLSMGEMVLEQTISSTNFDGCISSEIATIAFMQ